MCLSIAATDCVCCGRCFFPHLAFVAYCAIHTACVYESIAFCCLAFLTRLLSVVQSSVRRVLVRASETFVVTARQLSAAVTCPGDTSQGLYLMANTTASNLSVSVMTGNEDNVQEVRQGEARFFLPAEAVNSAPPSIGPCPRSVVEFVVYADDRLFPEQRGSSRRFFSSSNTSIVGSPVISATVREIRYFQFNSSEVQMQFSTTEVHDYTACL